MVIKISEKTLISHCDVYCKKTLIALVSKVYIKNSCLFNVVASSGQLSATRPIEKKSLKELPQEEKNISTDFFTLSPSSLPFDLSKPNDICVVNHRKSSKISS